MEDIELTGQENPVKPAITRPAAEVDGSGSTGEAKPENDNKWRDNFVNANRRYQEKINNSLSDFRTSLDAIAEALSNKNNHSEVPASTDSSSNAFDYNAWLDKEVNSRVERLLSKKQLDEQIQQARKIVESQDNLIKTDEDKQELMDLMQKEGLDDLFETNPHKAVNLGIKIFKEERGISPKTDEQRAAGVRGSAPAKNGPSAWTRERIANSSPEEVMAHKDEIKAAIKSGQLT